MYDPAIQLPQNNTGETDGQIKCCKSTGDASDQSDDQYAEIHDV